MALLIPLMIVALVVLAARYGSDSRDGRDWAPTPASPRRTRDIVLR